MKGKRALILAVIVLTALLIAPKAANAGLLAPRGACPNASESTASKLEKRHAIRCLMAYARAHAGRRAIGGNRKLHTAAVNKASAILNCGFSHFACGHELQYWAQKAGWCTHGSWALGENLGEGYETARTMMRGWLASTKHRNNILGRWRSVGVAYRAGPQLYVVQFGRCT